MCGCARRTTLLVAQKKGKLLSKCTNANVHYTYRPRNNNCAQIKAASMVFRLSVNYLITWIFSGTQITKQSASAQLK